MADAKPKAKAKRKAAPRVSAGRNAAATAERERIFVEAYITTSNAAHAAREAGYKPEQSHIQGGRLLKRPKVAAAIAARQAELAKRFEVTTENTIGLLASITFFDPLDFFDAKGCLRPIELVPLRARQALAGFKVRRMVGEPGAAPEEIVEVKFLDRGSQVEKLMRHLGLFEKDRKQQADAVAELLEYVAAAGNGLAVKPR